jgi:hypothetical protein
MIQRILIHRILAVSVLGVVLAALPAHADRDAVQFGTSIHVPHDGSVQDAVCFFCNVVDEGEVNGDIVVFFGNVHISGAAHHDVVNFFGKVTAEDNASIGQDLVSFFGAVRLGENVSVGKDLVAFFGSVRSAATVTVGGDRVVQPGWIFFGPLLLVVLVIVVVTHEYRTYRRRMLLRGYPFPPQH